ncbi:MAG: hypothetical protein ACOYM2_19590, partial [Rectinemataceae bacterium]
MHSIQRACPFWGGTRKGISKTGRMSGGSSFGILPSVASSTSQKHPLDDYLEAEFAYCEYDYAKGQTEGHRVSTEAITRLFMNPRFFASLWR